MIIIDASKEYFSRFASPRLVFNTVFFNDLNANKVDYVKYLLFKDTKYRFALSLGIKDNRALCPFSAPFGCFEPVKAFLPVENYDNAIECLEGFLKENGVNSIEFTLPPSFYFEDNINITINALFRKSYTVQKIDLNYSFDLERIHVEDFATSLPRNGRKNLAIALSSGLTMSVTNHNEISQGDLSLAYEIIKKNRDSKGYPLRMSLESLWKTIQNVRCDLFFASHDEIPVASAIVYHTTDTIAQVIYWGDLTTYSESKPINFLSYNLLNYYKKLGFRYLDIGPSSEDSLPNYGLCDFKTSIGCNASTKIKMSKKLI
jgi:hypothetical protein